MNAWDNWTLLPQEVHTMELRMRFIRHWSIFQVSIVTMQLCKSLKIKIKYWAFWLLLCMSYRMRVGVTEKETGRKQNARKRKQFFLPSFLYLPFFPNNILTSSLRSSNMFWSYLTNSSYIHLPSLPIQHFAHLKNKTRPIKTNLFCSNILGYVTFHWSTVDLSGATQKVGHEVLHLGKELFTFEKL